MTASTAVMIPARPVAVSRRAASRDYKESGEAGRKVTETLVRAG
jgi:hypothetical protein